MNAKLNVALGFSTLVVSAGCSAAGGDGGTSSERAGVNQETAQASTGTRNAAWGNVGRDASGLLHVLAIGEDGFAYEKHQQAGLTWTDWAQTAFDSTGTPINFSPSNYPTHFGSNEPVATAWVGGAETLVAMALSIESLPGDVNAYTGSVDAGATWVHVGSGNNAPDGLSLVNCGACGNGLVAVGWDTSGTESQMVLAYQLPNQGPTQWANWITLPAPNAFDIHFNGQQMAELDDDALAVFAEGRDGTSASLFMTSHKSPTDLHWNDWTPLPSAVDDDSTAQVTSISTVGYVYSGGHRQVVLWGTASSGKVYFLAQNQTALPTHGGFDTTWRVVDSTNDGSDAMGDSLQAFGNLLFMRGQAAVANGPTSIMGITMGSLTGSFGAWTTVGDTMIFQNELAGGFNGRGRIELFDTVAGGVAWQTAQEANGAWYNWSSMGRTFP